jgi:vitamin B12 transporter
MQKSFLVLLIFLLLSGISVGQTEYLKSDSLKTYRLSDIVITATKTSTPLSDVASSVTVLNEKELLNSGETYLSDVLQQVPGLTVTQQGGPGKITSIFLRGAKPHHTLVLIDGVEMNDPGSISNSFDFANLQTSNIERVEILRGPQSTLYGSDALAGVVSIFTKQGNGKPKFIMSGEGGTYNTYKGSIGTNGSIGLLKYFLNLSTITSDGFSAADKIYGNTEKDSYQNKSLYSRINLNPSDVIGLEFILNYSRSKAGLDQNEKFGDDPNFNSDVEEILFKAGSSVKLFQGLWFQNIGISFIKNINKTVDGTDAAHPSLSSNNYFTGNRIKMEWQNNFNLYRNNVLTFGIETEQEKAYSSYLSESQWGPFISEFPVNKAATTGIYLQDQLKLFDSFSSAVGVRYDKHNRFGSALTYRIAPSYFIYSTNTKLKATYGTGFKSPSLYYLFEPTYGNINLKPEKSRGWDAGIEQYLFNYKLSVGITYFRNDFSDLIGFDSNFKTINIDKAETKGAEFYVSSCPARDLEITANYTYTDSKDKSTGSNESGKNLIRVPQNKISININYFISKTNFNVEILNVGSREDKDYSTGIAERVKLKPYTLVNMAVTYQLLSHLSLYGRAENLFNTEYEQVLYYGTPGLSFYGGIRFNL